MTIEQLYWFSGLALILTVIAALLTRATLRRIVGASAGATAGGPVAIAIIVLCEKAGWWHMVFPREPYFLALLWLSLAFCGYVFLLTWRIARRFGARGLAVAAGIIAILGPLRDSLYMAKFPEWGSYAPGLAPMLAISVAYLVLGIVGHGLMRLIAGPADRDQLARRPWDQS